MDFQDPVPSTVWQRLADPVQKRAFAALLLAKPDNDQGRYEAAVTIFPDPADSFLVYQIKEQWPNDPVVIAEKARLSKATPPEDLPTVEQIAKEVYALSIDNTKSVKERLEAYRLYCEVRQILGKGTAVTVNNNTINDHRGVYVIPERSTDPVAFQELAIGMQARLVGAKSTA